VRGVSDALDQRYRLVPVYMTAVRFATPLRETKRFVAALAAAKQLDFWIDEGGAT
jgi:hypothetical protein